MCLILEKRLLSPSILTPILMVGSRLMVLRANRAFTSCKPKEVRNGFEIKIFLITRKDRVVQDNGFC